MKKNITIIILLLLTLSSCDNGFQQLNVNPNKPAGVTLKSKLTATEFYFAGRKGEVGINNIIYTEHFIQHFATIQGSGDSYTWNKSYASYLLVSLYGLTVKNLYDMLDHAKNENSPNEMKAIIRILKVLVFQRLTDLYGDLPYFEAGQGYINKISSPKYDPQEAIYNDMLKELEESIAILPNTGTSQFGDADLYYKGDFAKWKKLGNSIMLRLALRMIKIDPTRSESWARKAINGGVMESNDDILKMNRSDGPHSDNKNSVYEHFLDFNDKTRASETFIDFLKNKNDPRLTVLFSLPENSTEKDEKGKVIKRTIEQRTVANNQIGLPNGLSTISKLKAPLNSLDAYSEPNRLVILGPTKPTFIFTYAQVAFNLAEAGERWSIGGNPEENYNNGVTAAMKMLSLYGSGGDIAEEKITSYLTENPYNDRYPLKSINEQYWVASFLDGYEAFANWRRSGFPVLIPVNNGLGVTNGEIPRRLTYPTSEQLYNLENYNEAIARQGKDEMSTRVWWDKE